MVDESASNEASRAGPAETDEADFAAEDEEEPTFHVRIMAPDGSETAYDVPLWEDADVAAIMGNLSASNEGLFDFLTRVDGESGESVHSIRSIGGVEAGDEGQWFIYVGGERRTWNDARGLTVPPDTDLVWRFERAP